MAAATPGRSEDRENIEYGRAGGARLLMDAHIPTGAGPFPAVILVHGGAWVRGDRRQTVQPLFEPLANGGFAWFSISYRLAGDLQKELAAKNGLASAMMLGTAVDDVRQAVAYVKAHAAEYRVDAGRIALIGESAGAQLASMAALKPGPRGDVQAVVALYGPSDLAALARDSRQIPDSIRQAVSGTPFENLLLAGLRQLSPVTWVRKDAPPFLLIHGTADALVPFGQSETLCAKLRGVGGSCELYPVIGGGHGIRWWESERRTAYKQVMMDWLEKQIGTAGRA